MSFSHIDVHIFRYIRAVILLNLTFCAKWRNSCTEKNCKFAYWSSYICKFYIYLHWKIYTKLLQETQFHALTLIGLMVFAIRKKISWWYAQFSRKLSFFFFTQLFFVISMLKSIFLYKFCPMYWKKKRRYYNV